MARLVPQVAMTPEVAIPGERVVQWGNRCALLCWKGSDAAVLTILRLAGALIRELLEQENVALAASG